MKSRFLSLTLVLVATVTTAFAVTRKQPLVSTGEGPSFVVDYAEFRGSENRSYVEFYIQVQFSDLQFIKKGSRFQAGYELSFQILDESGRVVDNQSLTDNAEVERFSETLAADRARISLFAFTLDPGRYQVEARMTDNETHRTSHVKSTFHARNYETTGLALSNIQFSRKIVPADDAEPYVKNQRYIEPNPRRVFASYDSARFYAYFEVYNLEFTMGQENPTYTTSYIFHDAGGEQIADFERTTVKRGSSAAHSLRLPIEQFPSGAYGLTIRIRDDATAQISEASNSFVILDHTPASSAAQTQ